MNGVLFIDDAFYKRRLEARARSGARSDVQCNCYSIAILSSTRSRVILVHFFSSVVRPCLGGVVASNPHGSDSDDVGRLLVLLGRRAVAELRLDLLERLALGLGHVLGDEEEREEAEQRVDEEEIGHAPARREMVEGLLSRSGEQAVVRGQAAPQRQGEIRKAVSGRQREASGWRGGGVQGGGASEVGRP